MIWLRRLGWTAAALLLLTVIAWLGLPALLLWQLPPRLSEALGRPVTIGKIEFTPWTLEVAANDVAIGGPPGTGEPQLQIGRIHADLSISSLVRRVPVIEAIEIDAPMLRVARLSDGHYDVDDLIARFAPQPAAAPSRPARFAIYNLQIRDGRLRFDDRPVQRVHSVDGLRLALPFISNLPAEVEIKVEPRVAFRLDGTAFDSGAEATPFAKTKAGTLKLAWQDLDLARYVPYLPKELPARIERGRLTADINVQFALPQGGAPSVSLQGTAEARDVALTDTAGQPLVDWQRLQIVLRGAQPLARKVAIESLRIEGARLHASRDAAGQVNLFRLAAATGPKPDAAARPASTPSAAVPDPPSENEAWQVSLDAFDLDAARVVWNDASVTPAAAFLLDGVTLTARQLQWPRVQPAPLTLNGTVRDPSDPAAALATFSIEGPVTDRSAKLNVALTKVSLAGFAPYVARFVVPAVEGQADITSQLDWSGAADAPRLQLVVQQATLDGLRLREGKGRTALDALSAPQLSVADLRVDALAHSVVLGSARLTKPSLDVARTKDGRLSVERWLVASATPTGTSTAPRSMAENLAAALVEATPASRPASSPDVAGSTAAPLWRLQLNDLGIEGGQLRWTDALASKGAAGDVVRAGVSDLNLTMRGLTWPAVRGNVPAEVQLSARVGSQQRERSAASGLVRYQGRFGIEPLQANGRVKVERFPVHLFASYAVGHLPVSLLRAEAGYTGTLALRQEPAAWPGARPAMCCSATCMSRRCPTGRSARRPTTPTNC